MEYNFKHFIDAQKRDYQTALLEIKKGRKITHWMWYIFPQHISLGKTEYAKMYGIKSLEEAKAYLENDFLRNNLIEISSALLELKNNDIKYIMGHPDHLKLRSSMTLFSLANPRIDVFKKVIDKYYEGVFDLKTIELIKEK